MDEVDIGESGEKARPGDVFWAPAKGGRELLIILAAGHVDDQCYVDFARGDGFHRTRSYDYQVLYRRYWIRLGWKMLTE